MAQKQTAKEEVLRRDELTVAHNDFSKSLNAYAFFKISNRTLGQEMVQDTFVKTWSYLLRHGKIDKMKAFLYHILNNLIVDEYRRKRKSRTTSLDALLEKGYDPSTEDPNAFINILDGKILILLIPLLPDMYKKVVQMRYVQGLSIAEIALLTRQSENSISVRLHRGIIKLRSLYSNRNNP